MEKEQKAFQIVDTDNVATALEGILPGIVSLLGDTSLGEITAVTDVPKGHKISLKDMEAGEDIKKYGIRIGKATQAIKAGEWVHLHNIHSVYDERSSHLDVFTGAPKDTKYE
ncbi:MAG TPA: hydrolase [Lachnoclostridium sp.]|uniref:Altronate hydrolase/altronate dehydratase small subunit n=1 Tax=[Clostridium] celerecrescens 18A TaxID=1286362 RepID=A0A2M8ZAE3_9FIRM|nr:UxaA family hydrolase [Lacrimispora celerecrescens]PJJ30422.1 altronate hydrolase/altronate dehydratase small subunit [[Clostridium] celerecrescens 18A]HBE85353.1 hydrolase [Lachnoclostridium sp.]